MTEQLPQSDFRMRVIERLRRAGARGERELSAAIEEELAALDADARFDKLRERLGWATAVAGVAIVAILVVLAKLHR